MRKLNKWLDKKKKELHETKTRLEIDKAKRSKLRQNKLKKMKPGVHKTLTEGLIMKKKPMQVMKEEYERRKYEREHKKR